MFFSYWIWHYSQGFRELFVLFRNFLQFITHFFSVKEFASTLLYPLPFSKESQLKGLSFLTRPVGFLIKLFFIILGSASYLLVFAFSIFCFFIWAILPIVFCLLLIGCLKQIF
jgi:hypothetical protein